jgi:hypothetical protein
MMGLLDRALDLVEKRQARATSLALVVRRGVVELALGEVVK